VSGKELGHTEGTDAVASKNLCHFLVGVEELFVFGVLEIVLLDVGPQLLDAFGTAGLLLANDVGQLGAELHGFGKSGSFRHDEKILRYFLFQKILYFLLHILLLF